MEKMNNLNAIRHIDPFADIIISKAIHAALFDYNEENEAWVKGDIEGPLFIYRRLDIPYYSLMIANRNSRNDFFEPIVEMLKISYQPPYIFLYQSDGKIRGLWIYGEDQCKRIYDLLELIIASYTDKEKLEEISEIISLVVSDSKSSLPSASSSDSSEESVLEANKSTKNLQTTPLSRSTGGFGNASTKGVRISNKHSAIKSFQTNNIKLAPKDVSLQTSSSSTDEDLQTSSTNTKSKTRTENQPRSIFEKLEKSTSSHNWINKNLLPTHLLQDGETNSPESIINRLSIKQNVIETDISAGVSNKTENIKIKHQKINAFSKKECMDQIFDVVNNDRLEQQNTPLVGLTKDQLIQALNHLLQNDSSFIDKIHQAYIDSLRAAMNK